MQDDGECRLFFTFNAISRRRKYCLRLFSYRCSDASALFNYNHIELFRRELNYIDCTAGSRPWKTLPIYLKKKERKDSPAVSLLTFILIQSICSILFNLIAFFYYYGASLFLWLAFISHRFPPPPLHPPLLALPVRVPSSVGVFPISPGILLWLSFSAGRAP